MRSAILSRLAALPLVVLCLSVLVFVIVYFVPGDAASSAAGVQASAAQIAQLRHAMGLDASLPSQYLSWFSHAVHGDLGRSLINGTPVRSVIAERFPVTLSLTFVGTVVACVVGIPAGILAGLRPRGVGDRAVAVGASVGIAFPSFWLGLILVAIFALKLSWLPATGYVPLTADPWQWLRSITLPAIALSVTPAAALARQMRNSLAETMRSDYVRTARAKNVPYGRIVWRHALRNAATPVLGQLGFWVAIMLGTSLIVEQVFSLPGIGDAMEQPQLEVG